MRKINQAREKREQNAAYAARFPRRKRKIVRKLRKERTFARELAWLTVMEIAPSGDNPVVRK